MAARLRRAREHAGFATSAAAIEAHGFSAPTYWSHENAQRAFDKKIREYAALYSVREQWLRYATGPMCEHEESLPVTGYIGPQGLVIPIKAGQEAPPVAMPPVPGDYLVYEVPDDANYPAMLRGDVLYMHPFGPPALAVGERCLARCNSGAEYYCVLDRRTGDGSMFTLNRLNAPPLYEHVTEAAPLAWLGRRPQPRPAMTAADQQRKRRRN